MTESDQPPTTDQLTALVADSEIEAAAACLERFEAVDTDTRKRALRALHELADDHPDTLTALSPTLAEFLSDDERAVRLITAKLCVALARAAPDEGPLVDPLEDRLADGAEFYFVRARCAEALGYVALEQPDVATPEVVAELRLGLSFDEPEVKQKLAKALEYVATGDPDRLQHHVSSLADHLDDDEVLVRYHLCTALAIVGCAQPAALTAAREALVTRLTDDDAHVRGRAAEALGVLDEESDAAAESRLVSLTDDTDPFASRRAQFALDKGSDGADTQPGDIGTIGGIHETTADAVTEITTPDGDSCSHCGVALPADGPPMCPRCGAPL